MYFFRLPISSSGSHGTLALQWNASGLLSRIEWYAPVDHEGPASVVPLRTAATASSNITTLDTRVRHSPRRDAAIFMNARTLPVGIRDLIDQLEGYFTRGEPIDEVPWDVIDQSGWTEFQSRVYRAITAIPHGQTRTYAWTAEKSGSVQATRAVGQALRKNPVPVLVPCHRVVAAGNGLGGFMGKSADTDPEIIFKRQLIQLEETYRNPVFSFLEWVS